MNKTAIKNYAIWARVNLIEAAKQRAYQYEITKDNITDAGADVVSGKPLTKEEKEQRRQLIDQINLKGFDQVMEEVAYTWFNRFIALRFMEVNGYLPTKIRVFTDSEGKFKPEILKEALTVELPVDKSRVMELLEKQDNEELYKMLLIAQCNELSNGLPDMFEVIANYTELLFPNNLLKEDSILGEMVNTIPEEDWTDAVQIIGWLYQYYNSELKDETFALLKKNVRITKEKIPAVTQLFTPDWIVRYMVENSLGRLWYEGHPNDEIKKEWKYYLDEAQQKPEVEEQLKTIREEYKAIKPEEIKVIDPCMGSGHILVYAFDVLMQIYTSAGWSERDAAESILENNLFGLDIDDRAGQLAYFAVMMKARKYSRRILTKNIRPKVFAIQESNNIKIEAWWRLGPEEEIARRLVHELTDAKEYGSILNFSVSETELQALRKRLDDIDEMSTEGNLLDVIQSDEITSQLYPLVELAEVMIQKYDVVVTNPPYMAPTEKQKPYLLKHYEDSKNDLAMVMIEKCLLYGKEYAFSSMIVFPTWMFLASYEKLRTKLIHSNTIINMVYPGRGIFGSDFGSTTFVLRKKLIDGYSATYMKLFDKIGEVDSVEERQNKFFLRKGLCHFQQKNYSIIPGSPIAFWISDNMLNSFSKETIGSKSIAKAGIVSGDDEYFLKFWHEINYSDIEFDAIDFHDKTAYKWVPINKGGAYRRHYGNYDYIINIFELWNCPEKVNVSVRRSEPEYYFKQALNWSATTMGLSSFRYSNNKLFATAAPCLFFDNENDLYISLALLNSCLSQVYMDMLNPTVGLKLANVTAMPAIGYDHADTIVPIEIENITLSKDDWDSYETTWDFKSHPLI